MVDYLDPAIAGEGQRVDEFGNTEGEFLPAAQAIIPQYEGLKKSKKYARYFLPYGTPQRPFQPFPAWLYHPKQAAVLARSAKEAKDKYGIEYRATTAEERARGFPQHIWDYHDTEWRAVAYASAAETNDAHKNVVKAAAGTPSQSEIIGAVVAAVMAQIEARGAPKTSALAGSIEDDPDYAEFLRFKQFKSAAADGMPLPEYGYSESTHRKKKG